MVPLSTTFFTLLPPTLRVPQFKRLYNGPGLVTEGLTRLVNRAPGLKYLFLDFHEEGDEPASAAVDLAGESSEWTVQDKLEAALTALAIPTLEHIGLGHLHGTMSLEECADFEARFAALPVHPNLRTLETTELGLETAFVHFLNKMPNLESLCITERDYLESRELNALMAKAVAALPRLTTIYLDGSTQNRATPHACVLSLFGTAPGTPSWEAAAPETRAVVEASLARGLRIKSTDEWVEPLEPTFPAWDAVEVGQHGEETPCVDTDVPLNPHNFDLAVPHRYPMFPNAFFDPMVHEAGLHFI